MRKNNLTKAVETTVAPNPKEVDIWVEPKDDDTVSLKYYDYHDNEWKGGNDGGDSNDDEVSGIILDFTIMYGGFCRFTITPTKNKDTFDVKLEAGNPDSVMNSFVQKNIIEEKTAYDSYDNQNYTYKYVEFQFSELPSLSGLFGSITQLNLNQKLNGELHQSTTSDSHTDAFGFYPSGGSYEDFDHDIIIRFDLDEEGNEALPNLWIHILNDEDEEE